MYLGIDIGATYCKLALLDDNGIVVKYLRERMPPPLKLKNINYIEFDVSQILDIILTLVKTLTSTERKKISSIGVAGQMHGMLLVNKDNIPVTNFISWQDKRTLSNTAPNKCTYLENLIKELGDVKSKTGTSIRSGMMGSLLYWLKDNGLNLQGLQATFLSDYIVSKLINSKPVCDPTNAASSGIFNLKEHKWLDEFFAFTQLDNSVLPEIVETGDEAGVISTDMAEFLSFSQGTKVFVSIGDYQASLLASKLNDSEISLNIGTGAQVSVITENLEINEKFEIRPYFNNKYTKCISGLPGGRVLAMFASFIKDINSELFVVKDEIDILSKLDNISIENISASKILCDLSNFNINGLLIKNINENNFNIPNLFYSLVRACVVEYLNALTLLDLDHKKYDSFLLSGGVTKKSKLILSLIQEMTSLKLCFTKYDEEAAVGAALLPNLFVI